MPEYSTGAIKEDFVKEGEVQVAHGSRVKNKSTIFWGNVWIWWSIRSSCISTKTSNKVNKPGNRLKTTSNPTFRWDDWNLLPFEVPISILKTQAINLFILRRLVVHRDEVVIVVWIVKWNSNFDPVSIVGDRDWNLVRGPEVLIPNPPLRYRCVNNSMKLDDSSVALNWSRSIWASVYIIVNWPGVNLR